MDRFLLIEDALTIDEIKGFRQRWDDLNPHMGGAPAADALGILDNGDAHLDVIEPLYDSLAEKLPEDWKLLVGPCALAVIYCQIAEAKDDGFEHAVKNLIQRVAAKADVEGLTIERG